MKLEKKEIIKNYILDETISVNERKDRFEIAWDIHENFESIKEDMRRMLATKIASRINTDEFLSKNYEVINFGFETEGKVGYPIAVFKPAWKRNQDEPPLFFALEFIRSQGPYFLNLHFGIKKKSELEPFEGSWKNLSSTLRDVLTGIIIRLENEFGKKWLISDQWIAYLNFDTYGDNWTMWKREFYQNFFSKEKIEDSLEELSQFYVKEFKKLVQITENDIDNFLRLI